MSSGKNRGLKALKTFYNIYCGLGALLLAVIALIVIFSVVARYFFSKSWQELQEFCVVCFALSSFWGMGLCILNNEHIIVDVLVSRMGKRLRRVFDLISLLITLAVMSFFTYQSFLYVAANGRQLSYGMRIPMYWLYGIMPLASVLCLICVVIRLVLWGMDIPNPLDYQNRQAADTEPGTDNSQERRSAGK